MKYKIDWKNHLIELFVVFVGIKLAFMTEGWRENYKNLRLEKKYLESFRADLEADVNTLDSLIQFYENLSES
jgi:hypothetical protein